MKKLISLILGSVLMFSCVGCGKESTPFKILSHTTVEIYIGETHTIELEFSSSTAPANIKTNSSALASIAAVENSENKKYVVTAKKAGEFTVTFQDASNAELGKVTVTILDLYPTNPSFNQLQTRIPDYTSWTEFGAHDPSLIEVDGMYYAFSTDVAGTRAGYQIRSSSDLLHFSYEQTAIAYEDLQATDYLAGNGEFQEAFDWCKTAPGSVTGSIVTSTSGTFSFWAPDVIKGADGKFWLYFSLTGYFGGSRSTIGLAKADNVLGPYKFDSLVVKSPGGNSTPNAIDAQIIYEENNPSKAMYMVYGSFFRGIHIIELDPATGRRKSGEYTGTYTDSEDAYYGTRLATGSMEGPVITYEKDVKVSDGNGGYTLKDYYYLMTSYGDLTSSYNMRYARSESITGPYTDINEATLTNATGNKIMGSFKWSNFAVDWNAPGHNDLITLSSGLNLMVYHCRTNYWTGQGNNFHYLYLSQYAFNEDGQMVVNPNRYAGEVLRKIDENELTTTELSGGKYHMVALTNSGTTTVESKNVVLTSGGDITGAGANASWSMSGDNFITITLGDDTYKGVVMPAWLQSENKGGLTITAISSTTGASLFLNMRF